MRWLLARSGCKTCEICGGGFFVKPYREGKARFCSQVCGGVWHARTRLSKIDKGYLKGNRYRAGLKPANSFESGHGSLGTRMSKGFI